jgi:hypothetical protein
LPTQLFGFAQLDLAGTLPLADGRYVIRDEAGEHVLVLETLAAPAPPRRRRRRPRNAETGASPATLPLTRATVVRAFRPFAAAGEAAGWLETEAASEEAVDRLVAEAVALLNRALHTQAVAGGDPTTHTLAAHRAATVRLGYGSGEELAGGDFAAAHEVDARSGGSPRRLRDAELRPQERLAAALGGRERIDACETMLLRARADLDAGRDREAALQLRVGLEALLVELRDALSDPGHTKDMAMIEARRHEAGEAANAALVGDLTSEQRKNVRELTAICERVLRRRRVLRG